MLSYDFKEENVFKKMKLTQLSLQLRIFLTFLAHPCYVLFPGSESHGLGGWDGGLGKR
jgi:hypothetical protein